MTTTAPTASSSTIHADESSAPYFDCLCGREFDSRRGLSSHLAAEDRRVRKAQAAAVDGLVAAFRELNAGDYYTPEYWIARAARHFTGSEARATRAQAIAVLDYFRTSDYRPTTNPREIVSITLRVFS